MKPPRIARLRELGLSLPLFLFAAAILGLPFVVHHTINAHAQSEALREARAFSSVISIVRSYYANNVSGRIQRANGLAILTERYHNLQGGVPIPATPRRSRPSHPPHVGTPLPGPAWPCTR